MLTVRHWLRLLDGKLLATGPRDWATLLRRSYGIDVLACPACSGRLRLVDVVTDPEEARAWIEGLGVPDVSGAVTGSSPHARAPPDPHGQSSLR